MTQIGGVFSFPPAGNNRGGGKHTHKTRHSQSQRITVQVARVFSQVESRLMRLLRLSFMSQVTMLHLMKDIRCNKTTQKYNVLINAFTLPVNEDKRATGSTGANIKGAVPGLIISNVLCQFSISALPL